MSPFNEKCGTNILDGVANPRFIGKELAYVRETLELGFKAGSTGTMKDRLERAFAERFSVRFAISSNSGTSPMHQCLMALGIEPGDEVIVTPLAPIIPTYVILQAGAIPIYADVDPETFLMDPTDVRRKIGPRTRALLPVHIYGAVCDMPELMKIAKENNLAVIEDAAQCMLGTDGNGRLGGTMGAAGSFSFDNKKHISSGEGGMLITNDAGLAERARRFGGLGFGTITAHSGNVTRHLSDFQDPDFKRHETFGYNYRLCELAAAVALGQFERVDEIVGMRRRMALRFAEVIDETNCDWLIPQKMYPGSRSSYWTFAVRYVGNERHGASWREFRAKFIEFGGDGIYAAWQLSYNEPAIRLLDRTGATFPNLSPQLSWCKGMLDGVRCPNAEQLQPQMLQFTTNQISDGERDRQATALEKAIRHFRTR